MQIKTPEDIGKLVKEARKKSGLTQAKLAQLCAVGTRFIVELEKGKPTCQLDKTLKVLHGLGIKLFDEEKRTSYLPLGMLGAVTSVKREHPLFAPYSSAIQQAIDLALPKNKDNTDE